MMARGVSKLFGFELMTNFKYPYFSRNIGEFWRRWHISLSTWFRDYIYVPLGGSRGNILQKIRNILIIFVVSGFWHGANCTFIFWGFLNALYFLPMLLLSRNRKNIDSISVQKIIPGFHESINILSTFILTCFAWIFFRANSLQDSFAIIRRIFTNPLEIQIYGKKVLILILFMVLVEWFNRNEDFGLKKIFVSRYVKIGFVSLIGCILILFGQFNNSEFIYFQF